MSSRNLIPLCLAALYTIVVLYVMGRWNSPAWQENPIFLFLVIILLAASAGIFLVLVILPRMGDIVGEIMYSSGEKLKRNKSMDAIALLAQGDYEGAIVEYQKAIDENPDVTFPISEIAKIHCEHLESPDTAINFLQEHLEAKEWPPDDAAFLMFRIIDILMAQEQYDAAKEVLEQVTVTFPSTRHSANASHKITEIEQIQFKKMMAQRAQAETTGEPVVEDTDSTEV